MKVFLLGIRQTEERNVNLDSWRKGFVRLKYLVNLPVRKSKQKTQCTRSCIMWQHYQTEHSFMWYVAHVAKL